MPDLPRGDRDDPQNLHLRVCGRVSDHTQISWGTTRVEQKKRVLQILSDPVSYLRIERRAWVCTLTRRCWTSIFDVAIAIKRTLGISRGEQRLCLDEEPLSLVSPLPAGATEELVLTHVRSPVVCDGCGRRRPRVKRVCSRYKSARYCCEACQRDHWPSHGLECRRVWNV